MPSGRRTKAPSHRRYHRSIGVSPANPRQMKRCASSQVRRARTLDLAHSDDAARERREQHAARVVGEVLVRAPPLRAPVLSTDSTTLQDPPERRVAAGPLRRPWSPQGRRLVSRRSRRRAHARRVHRTSSSPVSCNADERQNEKLVRGTIAQMTEIAFLPTRAAPRSPRAGTEPADVFACPPELGSIGVWPVPARCVILAYM